MIRSGPGGVSVIEEFVEGVVNGADEGVDDVLWVSAIVGADGRRGGVL